MPEPFSGKVGSAREFGKVGRFEAAIRRGFPLGGSLSWAVNNEGRSSHPCSEAIITSLDQKPGFGILQLGTNLAISSASRG
jgi:hypothetical protein